MGFTKLNDRDKAKAYQVRQVLAVLDKLKDQEHEAHKQKSES